MKHKVISKNSLGNDYWKVVVELLPGTPEETQAIARVQDMDAIEEATEEEKTMVNDYLLFNVGPGVVVGMMDSPKGYFALKTTTK